MTDAEFTAMAVTGIRERLAQARRDNDEYTVESCLDKLAKHDAQVTEERRKQAVGHDTTAIVQVTE